MIEEYPMYMLNQEIANLIAERQMDSGEMRKLFAATEAQVRIFFSPASRFKPVYIYPAIFFALCSHFVRSSFVLRSYTYEEYTNKVRTKYEQSMAHVQGR